MTSHRRDRLILVVVATVLTALLACNAPIGALRAGTLGAGIPEATSTPLRYEGETDMVPGEMDSLPESVPEPWRIQTADDQPLISEEVGPQGGTLTVDQPGGPLDGFSITVPPGAYDQPVRFEVSAAEITSHSIPADMTVITPLIDVHNGGVEANEFLELHLPRPIGEGRFAMLFTYDPETEALDALPLIEHDGQGLTALTTHFTKILGVEVNTAELDALNIQTGFKHGRNSWQFANNGSYISPGGHCAGQTLMAMDYFLRFKGQPLFGKYDNYDNIGYPVTPNQQDDDRLAYRLCSVAQEGLNWDDKGYRYWLKVQKKGSDFITYYSFALALRASNEPQLVAIFDAAGGGHAMIVYGKYADRFYISDPNYPKADANRYLSFNRSTGKFRPYYSGATAASLGTPFPRICYTNKYYLISDLVATALWAELEAGTVGGTRFPTYKLIYIKTLPDLSTASLEIFAYNVFVDEPDAEIFIESDIVISTYVYDQANSQVQDFDSLGSTMLPVTNRLGTPYLLAMYGEVDSDWVWIDGRWLTLYRGISGTWHGAACAESESNPYRWEITLSQSIEGDVTGDVYFHACPGGGAAFYSVSGTQIPGQDSVKLAGSFTGGRGDLGDSAPRQTTFTVKLNESPAPNFAP